MMRFPRHSTSPIVVLLLLGILNWGTSCCCGRSMALTTADHDECAPLSGHCGHGTESAGGHSHDHGASSHSGAGGHACAKGGSHSFLMPDTPAALGALVQSVERALLAGFACLPTKSDIDRTTREESYVSDRPGGFHSVSDITLRTQRLLI